MTENQKRDELKVGKNNYSIVAGAGAGKTTLLSERISSQIKDGDCIESFAIITYTNVAAAELREKITNRLIALLKDASLTASQRSNVENAINNIDLLQISTIHSFLLKLLKEHCVESGIALDVEKLEESQVQNIKKRFFDSWYNTHVSDVNSFRQDWKLKNSKGKLVDRTYEVMFNMFMDIASVREEIVLDSTDYMTDCVAMAKDIFNECSAGAVQFGRDVETNAPIKKDGTPASSNTSKAVVEYARELDGLNPTTDEEFIEAAVIISKLVGQYFEKEGGLFGYNNRDNYRMANERVDSLAPVSFQSNKFVKDFNSHLSEVKELAKINSIVTYVINIQKAYQQRMDSDVTVITDDDILYRAKKLLVDNVDILDELRTRYTKIYLDEAQDTTAIQLDIIKLLAGKLGTSLAPFQIKDNNLIIVGDPKQSIYRFTGAQKEIYDQLSDSFDVMPANEAQKVVLEANFRSNKRIVDWVNARYWDMIKNCGHKPMTTNWDVCSDEALSGVYYYEPVGLHNVDEDVKAVTAIIKSMVDNPNFALEEYHRASDPEKGEATHSLRQIRYSDFLVITKKTPKIGEYMKEFEKQGIPVQVHGKFDISMDVILNNYLGILESIANGKSKMKSVKAIQVIEDYVATDVEYDQVVEDREAMNKLRAKLASENMSASAIAHYIANHEELYLEKNHGYSINEVKSFRKRIHQMIDSCISSNDGNLSGLVDAIKNYMNTKLSNEISLVHGENAVDLMNVHKSKGLTGNIVIIADRRSSDKPTHQGFISGDKYYPSVRYGTSDDNPIGTVKPSFKLNSSIFDKSVADENAEQERLEYVAATRAAHALIFMPIICDARGNSEDGVWFQYCNNNYDGYEEYLQGKENLNQEISKLRELSEIVNKKSIQEFIDDRNVAGPIAGNVAEIVDAHNSSITMEQLSSNLASLDVTTSKKSPTPKELMSCQLELSVTPSGFEFGAPTGYGAKDAGYVEETDRPKGNIFGNVLHRSCELIVYHYDRLKSMKSTDRKDYIRNIILKAIYDYREDILSVMEEKLYLNYLCTKLDEYFEQVISPIMEKGTEIYPEYEFSFFVPKDELADFYKDYGTYTDKLTITEYSNGIWVNGKADLVVKTKQGAVEIYDYKSDSRNGKPIAEFEACLKAKYEGQLKLYRYAMSKAFGVAEDSIATELIHLYMLDKA